MNEGGYRLYSILISLKNKNKKKTLKKRKKKIIVEGLQKPQKGILFGC